MKRASIFLADDHAGFMDLTIKHIGTEFEVIATFSSGRDIVEAATAEKPDLIVLDISMPGLNGIEVAAHLRAANCLSKVIFLTVHNDQDYLHSALAAGALGYVVKDCLASDLVPALREVLAGHVFVSRSIDQDAEI